MANPEFPKRGGGTNHKRGGRPIILAFFPLKLWDESEKNGFLYLCLFIEGNKTKKL